MAIKRNTRVCKSRIGVGPEIGTVTGQSDSRVCLSNIGVGPGYAPTGDIITYGGYVITYGGFKIRY